MVPEEYPLIILDRNYAVFMARNGKDTKHIRQISRRVYFVKNVEKFKMHKIDLCEEGLKLSDITTKNIWENSSNTGMKYIMFVLDSW